MSFVSFSLAVIFIIKLQTKFKTLIQLWVKKTLSNKNLCQMIFLFTVENEASHNIV